MRYPIVAIIGFVTTAELFAQAPPPVAPGELPGTNVGKEFTFPIRRPVPQAAPSAGTPVGASPTPGSMAPTSPSLGLPSGSINPNAIVGPVPTTMLPTGEKSLWQKFVDEFGVDLGIINPPPPPNRWVPGIARRNRERDDKLFQRWWRD